MADRIFSAQRSAGGDAMFISQIAGPTRDISISFVANPVLTANPQKYSLLTISFVGAPALSATLRIIPFTMRANLSGAASLVSSLKLIESRLSTNLLAASTLSARLSNNVVIPLNLAATLIANPTLSAQLMLSGESNIPRSVRLKAVPKNSDTLQLSRFRGDTYADAFQIFDDNTGLPVDISGCVIRLALATVKDPVDGNDVIYTLVGDVDDPKSGIVYFTPTAPQADRVGHYYYDTELRDGKGLVSTLVSSSYVYQQDITK